MANKPPVLDGLPFAELQRLSAVAEPSRCHLWLQWTFEYSKDSHVVQLSLWQAYKRAFESLPDALPASDVIKACGTVIEKSLPLVEQLPNGDKVFVIQNMGVRDRQAFVTSLRQMWEHADNTTEDAYKRRPRNYTSQWKDSEIHLAALDILIACRRPPPTVAQMSQSVPNSAPSVTSAPPAMPVQQSQTKRPASMMSQEVNGNLAESLQKKGKLAAQSQQSTSQPVARTASNNTDASLTTSPRKSRKSVPPNGQGAVVDSPLSVGNVRPAWVEALMTGMAELKEQISATQTQLTRVEQNGNLLESRHIARSANSRTTTSESILQPLLLQNSTPPYNPMPPPASFPRTVAAMYRLNAPELSALETVYALPGMGSLEDRRRAFGAFIGRPL